jgi:hypothetical protein
VGHNKIIHKLNERDGSIVKFGLKFGFFESGNKTRCGAILDYLNIKVTKN